MSFQVIAASVSDTNAFNPTIGSMDFCIPTISSIVSHFIRLVLSEAETFRINANLHEEVVCLCHKIPYRRMTHCVRINRLLNGHLLFIHSICNQAEWCRRPWRKIMLRRFVWVDEIFQFGHVEFTQSNHPLTRRDLITVPLSNLYGTKR